MHSQALPRFLYCEYDPRIEISALNEGSDFTWTLHILGICVGAGVQEAAKLVFGKRTVIPTTAAITTGELEKSSITLYFSMLQNSFLNFIRYFNTKHTLK